MEFACPCLDQWTLDALFVSAQIVKSLRVLGITDATGLPDDSLDVLDDWMGSDKERRGLVLIGDHASGKTLMASLIMRNYLKRGMTAYLTRIDDMRDAATAGFDESGDAREEANYRYDRKVRNVDLLVVDEMDSVSKTTEFMQENFSRILRAREGNLRPTLLLSRRDSDWIRQKYYDAAGMIGSMEIHKIERGPWGQKDIERKANETSLGITRPRVLE
jgi:DNA replication protein DnaC